MEKGRNNRHNAVKDYQSTVNREQSNHKMWVSTQSSLCHPSIQQIRTSWLDYYFGVTGIFSDHVLARWHSSVSLFYFRS